ncbi:hypothetical protein ACQCU1_14190 [Sutcliffiella horikoshii]|uniref:Aerobactin siderophore biosynthesis IucA/IucC-like C-terminal domain-containing protein n=1 Tax=Sutcliffiella horikoshii TaxID=79883 RepID=A0ABM6KGI6_9BACI|nr:(2Fe-2S)-binding protein [Sutcliffiella horikoshii]ART75423.1 hypothetical protein B4U37_04910 [Sutcliffiella horikoshii]
MQLSEINDYIKNKYFISIGHEPESIMVHNLIEDTDVVRHMTKVQTSQMNQCAPTITGTIFGKRYSVLAMAFLDMYIQYGILLDLRPSNVGIVLRNNGGMRYTLSPNAILHSDHLDREQKEELKRTFFTEHLLPLFAVIAKETKSKESHMHSLVSHNLVQKSATLKDVLPEKNHLIEETLHFLLEIYEVKLKNGDTYQHQYRLYTSEDGKESFYVRNHCCLAYLLHEGDKSRCCGTCPLISDNQR